MRKRSDGVKVAAVLAAGLLAAACSSHTTGAKDRPTGAGGSTSVSSSNTSSSSALPAQCQPKSQGQVLSKGEAAACYPTLAGYVGAKLPVVTNAFTSEPVDLSNAQRLALVAHDGLVQFVAGLRATRWPADVAPLCSQLADKDERYAAQMMRIVEATNVTQAEAAFHEFEKIRGPVPPEHLDPIARQIRLKLGLLPPPG